MNLYFVLIAGFFVPAVFGSFSPAIVDDMHVLENDCAMKSGAAKDDIEFTRKNHVVPANQQMSDFSKCMLQKFKVMNPDGSINHNVMEHDFPADVPNYKWQVSENCIAKVGQNDNETYRNIMECFLEHGQMVLAYI
uniref:Odorant-binding protein 26 n=1 Tax=Encarsia formosa TaxID=32400 RepID=A0A514TTY4_ENCFO|nr:odorant-binding protein 26 [Encarsia formosa]